MSRKDALLSKCEFYEDRAARDLEYMENPMDSDYRYWQEQYAIDCELAMRYRKEYEAVR